MVWPMYEEALGHFQAETEVSAPFLWTNSEYGSTSMPAPDGVPHDKQESEQESRAGRGGQRRGLEGASRRGVGAAEGQKMSLTL